MKVLSGAVQARRRDDDRSTARPSPPRDPLEARRAGVAMIYQELRLAPHLTVAENILLGVEPAALRRRRRAPAARARPADPRSTSGIPTFRRRPRAGALSVGAQQLVEIARALAVGCRVLVLDEPTSSLAREDAERLFALIRRLRDQGLAIVYISHFLEEVQHVADRFTVLRDGRDGRTGPVAGTVDERDRSPDGRPEPRAALSTRRRASRARRSSR